MTISEWQTCCGARKSTSAMPSETFEHILSLIVYSRLIAHYTMLCAAVLKHSKGDFRRYRIKKGIINFWSNSAQMSESSTILISRLSSRSHNGWHFHPTVMLSATLAFIIFLLVSREAVQLVQHEIPKPHIAILPICMWFEPRMCRLGVPSQKNDSKNPPNVMRENGNFILNVLTYIWNQNKPIKTFSISRCAFDETHTVPLTTLRRINFTKACFWERNPVKIYSPTYRSL